MLTKNDIKALSRDNATKDQNLEMINTPGLWPQWPHLPLVNIDEKDEDKKLGYIVDDPKLKNFVVIGNLHVDILLARSGTMVAEDLKVIKYETPEEMYEDGWRVD